ncbi:MAG: helix-turn-helix domain-containing protein [Acidimicrobiia bacterium]
MGKVWPLRALREARGLSLRFVARQVGIDPAHLSRIERGLASPSLHVLKGWRTRSGIGS